MAVKHHNSQKRPLSEPDPNKTSVKQRKPNYNYSHYSRTASAFWDNLSQLWLTTSALQEFNRRKRRDERPLSPKTVTHIFTPQVRQFWEENHGLIHQPANEFLHYCPPYILKDIQQFARCGGPDLSGLRGVECTAFENLKNLLTIYSVMDLSSRQKHRLPQILHKVQAPQSILHRALSSQ